VRNVELQPSQQVKYHLNVVLFSLGENILFPQPYLPSKFSLEERETCVLELQRVGYEEA
jgi:hypothetical protein